MKRKSLLFFSLILSFSGAALAQIPRGSTLLGGSLGFTSSKTSTTTADKGTNISIAPAWGTAIKENTFIGFSPAYFFSHVKNNNAHSDQKISGYSASVFVRKYIPLITRVYLFGDAATGFSYSTQKQHTDISRYENKSWGIGLNLQPGISFAANNKVHLEIGLNNLVGVNYTHSRSTSVNNPGLPEVSKTDVLGIGGNLSGNTELRIGIRFLLAKKS